MQYYAGVDLGATNIEVGIVDEEYNILFKVKARTRASKGCSTICEDVWTLVQEASHKAEIPISQVCHIGMGCPGTVDTQTGTIEYSCNLNMEGVSLSRELFQRCGKPVYMENDANCAARGEMIKGAAKGYKTAIVLTLGTGVGGGIVIDKKTYSGFNFFGGEIGHMVIEVDGVSCPCGRKGCFERYASATGLIRMTKEAMEKDKDSLLWTLCQGDLNQVDGTTAFNGQKQKDQTAEQVLTLFFKYLAAGVTNVINIFQPEILVIGGGLSGQGDTLLVPLRKIVYSEVYSRRSRVQTKIAISSLGNDAGIIGAASLGSHHK